MTAGGRFLGAKFAGRGIIDNSRSPGPRMTISAQFIRAICLERDKLPEKQGYPYTIPAIAALDELPLHPSVTIFIGENGSGKSTLLEALAVGCGLNAEGGSRNFNFSTRASHSDLWRALRVVRGVRRPQDSYFLRAESYFTVATEIERLGVIDSHGGKSPHEQSHGESFFALLSERFRGNGLYFLDEPEAALSPSRQLSMLRVVHDLVRERAQFILVTHSPILMAYPDAWIYQFGQDGIHRVEYTSTEHYIVMKNFLDRREKMLAEILSED